MRSHMTMTARTVFMVGLLIGLSGCGEGSTPNANGAVGVAASSVLDVAAAQGNQSGETFRVRGSLISVDDTWLLCDALAESYPPQCGGDHVTVLGVDGSGLSWESAHGVRWIDNLELLVRRVEGGLQIVGDAS